MAESDRLEAERKIQGLGIQEHVSFAGVVWGERKAQLLVDADAFAYPTYYPLEAHPLVIVEALEAGLPVITTRWAAIPEIIEDGVNGLLVKTQDADDLAEKITQVIREPALRERICRANRRRFEDFYTHEHYGNRMVDVFQTLAGRRDPSAGRQRPTAAASQSEDSQPHLYACVGQQGVPH
jgi:glycosyltransferase involved in cell wall biosynthesis